MNRQAQAVVLLLLGGAVLRASLTDLHLRYVKEGLRPFLVAAGLLLLATAAMTLWYELRPDDASDNHRPSGDGRSGDGHDHDHGHGARVGWLLILPVLGLLLVAPPALGSYVVTQAGTMLSDEQAGSDYPPLPAGDPVRISVLDYASRALFEQGRSIGERRVQLTGFVVTGSDGQPLLARVVLSCCAADGRPVKVGLTGDLPFGVADDTWVEVVGRYTDQVGRDSVNDALVPYLEVESWRPVPTPKQQYE